MAELVEDLRGVVAAERQRFRVPGCAVLVVAQGQVVLSEGSGHRDREQELPVTPRTLFPIASSTKTFTAALCAALVDEGRLEWHRPVRDYLPAFRMHDPVATAQLTVYDLLCHRSGLPRHDLLWYSAVADGSLARQELLAALPHLAPSRAVREVFQYNNLLYTLAGELAGQVVGTSYEDAVATRLLRPLGMERSTFSVDQVRQDPDTARPYTADGIDEPLAPVPYAPLELVAPAGGLNSCLADLAPWLLTLLGHGVGGASPRLSDSVRSLLTTPAVPLPERSLFAVNTPVGYGLGTLIEDYRGYRIVHHGGNIDGFSSMVSTIPEADCAVAVLANRDGTSLRDTLPLAIYDRLLELAPRPHGETLLAREAALRQGRAQSRARTVAPRDALPVVRPLADYVGTYHHPGYGRLVVSHDGDALAGRYRSLAGPLRHQRLEVFSLMLDLGGVPTPLPLQFHHDFDGDVTGLTCRLEPTVPPIRFDRVPDTSHLDEDLLAQLSGTYRLGPLVVQVGRRGERELVAMIVEGGSGPLVCVRDRVFRAGEQRVEFTDDGRLLTAWGEFTRSE